MVYRVLEGKVFLWQFLQTDNDVVLGRIGPGARGHKIGASALIFRVVENAQFRPLDIDRVAGFDQLFGN